MAEKRKTLLIKFVLSIFAVIILTSVTLSWFFIKSQIIQIRTALKDKGETLVRNVAYNSEYGVLTANKEFLLDLIEGVVKEEDVVYCLVQDKEGEILALTGEFDSEQILKKTKKNISEELKAREPLMQLYRLKKESYIYDIAYPVRTYRTERRWEEIGLMETEIEKEEVFWDDEEKGVKERSNMMEEKIGIVRVGVSLTNANQQISRLKNTAILLTCIVVMIGILIAIFLVRIIVKPVKQLVLGTQKIAQGDLSYQVEVKSRDEIGELAHSFNQMTRKLKDTQAQLIQSAKMSAVGQLGAGVAHELNNPLGGILGYAQFILEKIKRPGFDPGDFKDCQRYIESMERESTRCKKIVENLLKFSKRPISAKPEPLDIARGIEETLSIVGHQLELINIKVITDIKPNVAMVKGVVNQLQQVFTNLILNAQQAMPDGGELKILAENIIDDKRTNAPSRIKIEFADTGCGIPEENLPRIFEPFFTSKQKDKGTGLGLSVSYQIIHAHKGNISVDSKEGKGTIFTITLPAINE